MYVTCSIKAFLIVRNALREHVTKFYSRISQFLTEFQCFLKIFPIILPAIPFQTLLRTINSPAYPPKTTKTRQKSPKSLVCTRECIFCYNVLDFWILGNFLRFSSKKIFDENLIGASLGIHFFKKFIWVQTYVT